MDLLCNAYLDDVESEDVDHRIGVLQSRYQRLQHLHISFPTADSCLQAMSAVLSQPPPHRSNGIQDVQDWQYFLQVVSATVCSQRPTTSQPERLIGKRKREASSNEEDDARDDAQAANAATWWLNHYQSHLRYTSWLCSQHIHKGVEIVSSLWFDYVVLHCDLWKHWLRIRSELPSPHIDCLLVEVNQLVRATLQLRSLGMPSQLPTSRRLVDYLLATSRYKLEQAVRGEKCEKECAEEAMAFWNTSTELYMSIVLPLLQQQPKTNQPPSLYFISGGEGDAEEVQALLLSSVVYLVYMPLQFLASCPKIVASETCRVEKLLCLLDAYGPKSEDDTLRVLSRSDVALFSFLRQLLAIDQQLVKLQGAAISEDLKHEVSVVLASLRFGFAESTRISSGLWLDSTSLFLSLCGDAIFAFDANSIMDIISGPDTATTAMAYLLLFFKTVSCADLVKVAKLKTSFPVDVHHKEKANRAGCSSVQKVIIWHDQQVVSNTKHVVFDVQKVEPSVWCTESEEEATGEDSDVPPSIEEEAYVLDNLPLLVELWEDVQDKLQDSFRKSILPFNPKTLCLRIQTFLDSASAIDDL